MLKYLTDKALKTIQTTHLYSIKPVHYVNETNDCRKHNGDGAAFAKNFNVDDHISRFKDIIKNKHIHKVPLRYFTDLGKIKFPTKTDYIIKLHLEKEMKQLFKSKKLLTTGTAIRSRYAQIIFTKAHYIQYEQ